MLKLKQVGSILFSQANFAPRTSSDLYSNSRLLNKSDLDRKKMPKKETKKNAGRKDHDDDNNRGGGLLEPIIEDLESWIQRRRAPSPAPGVAAL